MPDCADKNIMVIVKIRIISGSDAGDYRRNPEPLIFMIEMIVLIRYDVIV
jgi:hypothetical protein